ncbi:MAG TPA: hypothetical protein VJX66_31910 [Amycolatopsis sp.]|nr:hypothetical protein [Amycolatopsis sp.]
MTTPAIPQRAIAALAALVHTIRPDWHEPGIAAAIRRCPPIGIPDIAIAFIRGALDPTNETPEALTHLNNRAWDTQHMLACPTHGNTPRRTTGECAGCYADRIEAGPLEPKPATPPPAPLRQLVAAGRPPAKTGQPQRDQPAVGGPDASR